MKYENIVEGTFLSRPNRFIAMVEIAGREEKVHVKNTGRCRELLIPGTKVFLEEYDNPNRKTKYSLIGVMKGNVLVNMDSQAPNKVVGEWLSQGGIYQNLTILKAEQKYGTSRFDFYMEGDGKRAFVEVKGVTLEEHHISRFPDAPTERGVKHIKELIQCMKEGYEAYIVFVIQMKGVKSFEPNDETHLEFGNALRKAVKKGVHVLAVDCQVKKDELEIDQMIPVSLDIKEGARQEEKGEGTWE